MCERQSFYITLRDFPFLDALYNRHCDSRQPRSFTLTSLPFPGALSTMSVCPPYAPFFGFAGVASAVSRSARSNASIE